MPSCFVLLMKDTLCSGYSTSHSSGLDPPTCQYFMMWLAPVRSKMCNGGAVSSRWGGQWWSSRGGTAPGELRGSISVMVPVGNNDVKSRAVPGAVKKASLVRQNQCHGQQSCADWEWLTHWLWTDKFQKSPNLHWPRQSSTIDWLIDHLLDGLIDRTDSFLNKSNWAWDTDMGLWRCFHQNPDCAMMSWTAWHVVNRLKEVGRGCKRWTLAANKRPSSLSKLWSGHVPIKSNLPLPRQCHPGGLQRPPHRWSHRIPEDNLSGCQNVRVQN